MQRVSVVGASGSGKSTLGRRLAEQLGAPYVELDAIHHLPDWRSLPRDDFRAAVGEIVAGDRWVVDGNYRAVLDLVWARADTVVWLDLPRTTSTARVVRRTVRRAVTRQTLWNGNREPLRGMLRLDPEQNIIRWAWVKQPQLALHYEREMALSAHAHLRFHRLRTRADVAALLHRPLSA
jgi:adenylate kinase family enzyme